MDLRAVRKHLDTAERIDDDVLVRLGQLTDAVHELRGLVAAVEHRARLDGATFTEIASVTGTTPQSAQERHRRRLELGHLPDDEQPPTQESEPAPTYPTRPVQGPRRKPRSKR